MDRPHAERHYLYGMYLGIDGNDNFAYASLLAFEKLAELNGGLNDTTAFEASIRIAQGNYIRKVRVKAVQVLDVLRNY